MKMKKLKFGKAEKLKSVTCAKRGCLIFLLSTFYFLLCVASTHGQAIKIYVPKPATGSVPGTMSAADKAKLDLFSAASTYQTTGGVLGLNGFSSITGAVPIGNLPTGTSSSTVALGNHTHTGVYDVAGAAAAVTPTSLGLLIGTNVQAYNSVLTTWAAITPGTGIGTWLATPTEANLKSAQSGLAWLDTAQTFTATQKFTSPWVTTDIKDTNGNSMLAFMATASAVDGFTFTNAATAGHAVTMAATGSDTNIDLALTPKGTGVVQVSTVGGESIQMWGGNSAFLRLNSGFGLHIELHTGGVKLAANGIVKFYSANDLFSGGAFDVGEGRNAAGVAEINSGTAGTFRDLKLRALRVVAVTFANAITSPPEGSVQAFTDSTTTTWGATITGSGSNHVLGYYDGTNWTVIAQ